MNNRNERAQTARPPRTMTVEMQAGIERKVPQELTPLERDVLLLLDWMPWCFATAEEFDATLERHTSTDEKPSWEKLLTDLVTWGYVTDTTPPTQPGFIPSPPEFSITSFGMRKVKKSK